jgi:hypothetical protein
MSRTVVILLSLALSACASPPVIEKPVAVEVERKVYVSMPADFLSPCQAKPARLVDRLTNGELRSIALQYQNVYAPCLESRLEAIRKVQP